MGYIEDLQIAAAMADTHVGEACASTEEASGAYNEAFGHVGAALGMVVQVIHEFGLAEEAFKASQEHMADSDSSIEKARQIIEEIGLGKSENLLAQRQAEQVQEIANLTTESLSMIAMLGRMLGRLKASTEEFGDDVIKPGYRDVESCMTLPDLLKCMKEYRKVAAEYFGEQP